ncbi:hypothetical protein SDC9_188510 [bioreactor metagenome]|uniref:Uncharacterized protein n=1 Tax=bioreactor metagenome TaxID=1076179 RepID=A0A645HQ45_9ZZZZ
MRLLAGGESELFHVGGHQLAVSVFFHVHQPDLIDSVALTVANESDLSATAEGAVGRQGGDFGCSGGNLSGGSGQGFCGGGGYFSRGGFLCQRGRGCSCSSGSRAQERQRLQHAQIGEGQIPPDYHADEDEYAKDPAQRAFARGWVI